MVSLSVLFACLHTWLRPLASSIRLHAFLSEEKDLTADFCSGFLQNDLAGRAGQLRAEDLRGCHGESDAQANEDGEETCADESDG